MTTPTIQRRRLGNALKVARERAGKTQDEAAEQIDAAASKISRLELGQSGIKLTDLSILLKFYGVDGDQVESLRDLARAGRQRGRWGAYLNAIPDWFRQYVDLEAGASQIRWYQAEIVPGLFQTGGYIRAVLTAGQMKVDEDELNQQIALRKARSNILDQPDPPQLNVILSESALRRNVGGSEVMREQLRYLADVAERRNIELQVLPMDAPTYATTSFSFTLLRFDHDAASDVVYLEDYTDASYLDRLDAVRSYSTLWDRLSAAALGPVESRHLILRLAEQHGGGDRGRSI
ncbi:helix-turn-helix domain-containing protein [Micromonospora sp. NPDC050417]|uniref:helix-turn-helix domain-containing protein n=1 Tax=Micromonospora sp. NPDC050417 TaxID=3364280 RepID=UPI003793E945